jgi:hypothetical protein
MSRYVRMLPRPFKLQRGEFGRKAMHNHLHNPWSIMFCLPCALRYFSIVLTSDMDQMARISSYLRRGERVVPNPPRRTRRRPYICPINELPQLLRFQVT